ncbi:hypothetical protein FS837_001075 [Tulasnella sp. UAMH 9824]|nr:hypothetical protein FS837_001075 [Tulasnella sp. UAMH 9824]
MPSYLGAPLPLLQTIIVKSVCYTSSEYQPLELLGGDTSNLRSVKLSRVAIRWPTGNFVQLKYLKLKDVTYDSLTAQPLLDALRASPGLQVLKLIRMRGKEIPQPSPTITLHHLKHITLYNCALSLVECILGGIQAPSCTGLTLSILDQRSLDVPHFLDVTLKPFHPILRKLHRLHGGSEVILDFRGFEWHTGNHWDEEGLSMYMESFNDPTLTEWIDRTLKGESGLMIVFGHGGTFSEAVLRSVAPMRCVTKVAIGKSWDIGSVGSVLQFLSKPLTTSASLPSLPCLQELYLPPKGWNTRDLLEMVQARFCTLGWEATERTPLTIDVVKWGLWGRGGPGLPLDLATLVNIRKTSGVNLGGRKHPEGTLALVWNDEASEAVWF